MPALFTQLAVPPALFVRSHTDSVLVGATITASAAEASARRQHANAQHPFESMASSSYLAASTGVTEH